MSSAEPEALALIARAAEGLRARRAVDPRSGDRACRRWKAAGVKAAIRCATCSVLSDRGAIRSLDGAGAEPPMRPRCARRAAPSNMRYGVDPAERAARAAGGSARGDIASSSARRARSGAARRGARGASPIGRASLGRSPTLHRLWQLLLKGHDGGRDAAALPIEAGEMALLRVDPCEPACPIRASRCGRSQVGQAA